MSLNLQKLYVETHRFFFTRSVVLFDASRGVVQLVHALRKNRRVARNHK